MFLALRWAALLTLGLASGCSCGGTDDDAPDGGGDGSINPNRVSGSLSISSVTESRVRTIPIDLTDVPIEAIMGEGERIEGLGQFGGSFEILDVPDGAYTLRIGVRYFATNIRRFEFAFARMGREDVGVVDEHTPVALTLAQLNPWDADDTIEMFSPSGGFSFLDALGLTGQPTPGTGVYTGAVDALLAQSRGEATSMSGDTMFITQVRSRTSDANEIRELVAGAEVLTAFEIKNGGGGSVDGVLTIEPPSRQQLFEWDSAAYLAAMDGAGPTAPTSVTMRARLVATPTDPLYGVLTAFPTLVAFTVSDTDPVSLDADFFSPFPSHWTELEIDELSAQVNIAPGQSVEVRAGAASLPGRYASGATPLMSPPSAVLIDGQDASAPLEAVAETPTLSWSAPSTGAANGYEIDVFQTAPEPALAAIIYTVDTSVRVPPGVLADGGTFYLVVRARSVGGVDLAASPLADGVPAAFAETATAPFQR